jgi:alpha-N-acetylglucosamine transferase
MIKTDNTQDSKNLVFIALLLAVLALAGAAFACHTASENKVSIENDFYYLSTLVADLQHQNEKQNHFSDDLTKVALNMCKDDRFKNSESCIRLVRIIEYNEKLEKGIVDIKLD